ncbi:AraC-like DNA-binding protein [Paucibacter oligotrophus]|uniref:AraC-like DNA-binding protein n=1 Tax=Roseateles oligotrophus TaxID=1769250 RepID=A0A840L968_9BURK|nr:AraC family transcriptional regulator [Roseateles oligotrophus]MBB4842679.1 AraC-like DNA-binding protein [Roseateles oligotrophus]
MTPLIRAAALSGYEAQAHALGLDAPALLRRFGLSRQALADPDCLIPYRAMMELLEHSAAVAGCPDLGLRLSNGQGLEKLGPVAVVIEHAASLHEAITLATRYIFVHSSAVRMATQTVPGQADQLDLCYHIEMPDAPPHAQALELALGVMLRCLRLLGQDRLPLLALLLPHTRQASLATYRQALDIEVLFEQPYAAVRLIARDLNRPLPKSNALLRQLAQAYLDQQFSQPELLFSDRVRMLLRQLLATGQASHQQVAQRLAIHPRTLQRRLGDEGSSFEQLKDLERRALFEQLIRKPDGPSIATLADMLGYAEPSALSRSAKRWFGRTPTQMRAKA